MSAEIKATDLIFVHIGTGITVLNTNRKPNGIDYEQVAKIYPTRNIKMLISLSAECIRVIANYAESKDPIISEYKQIKIFTNPPIVKKELPQEAISNNKYYNKKEDINVVLGNRPPFHNKEFDDANDDSK